MSFDKNFEKTLDAMFGNAARNAGVNELWQVTCNNGAYRAVCLLGGKPTKYALNKQMMEALLKADNLRKNPIVRDAEGECWQK